MENLTATPSKDLNATISFTPGGVDSQVYDSELDASLIAGEDPMARLVKLRSKTPVVSLDEEKLIQEITSIMRRFDRPVDRQAFRRLIVGYGIILESLDSEHSFLKNSSSGDIEYSKDGQLLEAFSIPNFATNSEVENKIQEILLGDGLPLSVVTNFLDHFHPAKGDAENVVAATNSCINYQARDFALGGDNSPVILKVRQLDSGLVLDVCMKMSFPLLVSGAQVVALSVEEPAVSAECRIRYVNEGAPGLVYLEINPHDQLQLSGCKMGVKESPAPVVIPGGYRRFGLLGDLGGTARNLFETALSKLGYKLGD